MGKLRKRLGAKVEELGGKLGRLGVRPVHLTLTGLVFSTLALLLSFKGEIPTYTALLALSGLMDMLDGPVARATGRATPLGAFLDSFIDRVSDVFLIVSFVNFGVDWGMVTALVVVSLLISYTRARAESLGVSLEGVGLIERGERVVALFVSAVLLALNRVAGYMVLSLLLALSVETVVHRVVHVAYKMKR
ncbi:CDP-alcohol phosphatidyltransferase family protein [Thermogladius sp.]|uniref:CDP-alcohol phosphatidyltransferase family protein n=1 Tax=Thermogladius sp. TaxID=2023064 RepID=UPI003D0F5079